MKNFIAAKKTNTGSARIFLLGAGLAGVVLLRRKLKKLRETIPVRKRFKKLMGTTSSKAQHPQIPLRHI
jgi:hypothetical protein